MPLMLALPRQVEGFPPALVEGDKQVRAEVSMPHKDLCFSELLLQQTEEPIASDLQRMSHLTHMSRTSNEKDGNTAYMSHMASHLPKVWACSGIRCKKSHLATTDYDGPRPQGYIMFQDLQL